jgi:hypothetical protein
MKECINKEQQKQFEEVFQELEEQIPKVSKETARSLYNYRGKYRFCLNSDNLDDENLLALEAEWDKNHQKMKTLEQIHKILKGNQNESGFFDIEAIDRELMKYTILSTQKELYRVAKIFTDYRTRLAIENSNIEELIKLKTKQDTSSIVNSQLIKGTFLKACIQLDASIFEPLIDEDQYFEGLDKYRFLHEMKSRFDVLKGEGVKEVQLVMGRCEMCFRGAVVYEFYDQPNIGKPAFSYNIQEKEGVIKDIFRCNFSSGYSRAVEDNRNPNLRFIKYD